MSIRALPCFQHVRWYPDRKELRRFAASMFVGFTLIGLLVALRQHHLGTATSVLWGIGVILALGAVLPGTGRVTYLTINMASGVIGYLISHLLLALIFFLLFVPLGALLRVMGKDLLQLRRGKGLSTWLAHGGTADPQSYYRRF